MAPFLPRILDTQPLVVVIKTTIDCGVGGNSISTVDCSVGGSCVAVKDNQIQVDKVLLKQMTTEDKKREQMEKAYFCKQMIYQCSGLCTLAIVSRKWKPTM